MDCVFNTECQNKKVYLKFFYLLHKNNNLKHSNPLTHLKKINK